MSQPDETVRRPRRWLLILACVLLSTLAVLGHYLYWYAPRERRAQPDGDSWVGRLWADERFAQALWLPYPHQNLPRLGEVTGLDGQVLQQVAGAIGSSAVELPGFGPLALPPADALTIGIGRPEDHGGGAPPVVLAAQVYPGFAAFARLAGRLAGNPWLSGGRVTADGRDLHVAWHGRTWVVASVDLANLKPRASSERPQWTESPASLGAVRAPRSSVDLLPQASRALLDSPLWLDWQDEPATLSLRSAPERSAGLDQPPDSGLPPQPDLEAANAVLLVLEGRCRACDQGSDSVAGARLASEVGAAAVADGAGARGMALFSVSPPLPTELPWAATFFEVAEDRWEVPAEDILELTGRDMQVAALDGWQVGAFQNDSLKGGRHLAPAVAQWTAERERPLQLAVWLQLQAGQREMARISAGLESSPLIARSQRRQWRGAELLLAALAQRFERAELLILEQPEAARFQLTGRRDEGPLMADEGRTTDN